MVADTIVYCYLLEFLQIDRDPGTGPGISPHMDLIYEHLLRIYFNK